MAQQAMNEASATRQDLEVFATNHTGFYGLDISRISSIFITQVMRMYKDGVIDTHDMLDEVKFLEGIKNYYSNTKAASTFKNEPLKGLMKKHFADARFIINNLGAHFGYEYGGNKNLKKVIEEAFSRNKSGYVDNDFINFIAHQSTIGALGERTRKNKLTGEWIVFQIHNGKNYYLTLASHDESDQSIYSRVCDAYDLDFGFLRKSS